MLICGPHVQDEDALLPTAELGLDYITTISVPFFQGRMYKGLLAEMMVEQGAVSCGRLCPG